MFKPFQGSDTEAREGIVGDWSWPYSGMHWQFAADGTCRYIEYAEPGHFYFEDSCSWKVDGLHLQIRMDTATFPNQNLEIGTVSEHQLILKWGNTGKVMKLVPTF